MAYTAANASYAAAHSIDIEMGLAPAGSYFTEHPQGLQATSGSVVSDCAAAVAEVTPGGAEDEAPAGSR